MQKGKKQFNKIMPIAILDIELYNGELFMPVTDKIVPGVYPYYLISNYGRLYHIYLKRLLKSSIDSKGYLYNGLQTVNGVKNCRTHRLVKMTFDYFDGCENAIINHKDGNKLNPFIENLEWSTFSENLQHAYDNGLHKRYFGNKSWMAKHTEEDAIKVCELLQERVPIPEILNRLNVDQKFVYSIKQRTAWTYISDKYDIPKTVPLDERKNLTIDQVVQICNYYQSNKKSETIGKKAYIMNMISGLNLPNTQSVFSSCNDIYNRRTFKYISKDYEF